NTAGAARLVRVMPTLRATLAELQAIDAGLPHDSDAEWPPHLAQRRRTLVLRLWDLARRAGWPVGYDRDPADPHRPHIPAVCLPTGGQVRSRRGGGPAGGPAGHLPGDGASRAVRARAIAEYLAGGRPERIRKERAPAEDHSPAGALLTTPFRPAV